MRHFFVFVFFSVLVTGLVFLGYFLFIPQNSDKSSYLSPIPGFLTLTGNKQVTLLDFWTPFIEKIQARTDTLPDYTAKSVLIYDLTTNKTLFEYNSTARMPMASLTKIMTAIVALENKRDDNTYIVSARALVGEDSMGLSPGEELSQEELLYGLMLPSGNDAAEVLASNYPAGRTMFIQAMNDKAKALGLVDTHFSNPSGLQGDGMQYTTASDLLVITRYALENFPLFTKVVSTYEYDIPATDQHKAYQLFNETNLLTSYPGVKGVKTGFTPEAGLCLVTLLDYQSHRIIGIILNSENRREEMKNFLDYSLKKLDIIPPPHQ
ncbi:MAG: serine hydrolase [Patescibacteria group bacterium]